MQFRLVVAALAISATVSQAQVSPPPTPPTPPAGVSPVTPSRPAAKPAPVAKVSPDYPDGYYKYAPRPAEISRDYYRDDDVIARAKERSIEAQQRASERSQEAVQRAMANNQERIVEAQQRAIERSQQATERSIASSKLYSYNGVTYAQLGNGLGYAASVAPRAEPGISYLPMPQWFQDDPADSLYRVAYEAMNRGDWRRAADQFSQVCVKFNTSTRCKSATYFEAFMHYRIGSTDELHAAQKLLSSDRAKSVSDGSRQAEIASLMTRVRGALAARGDQDAAKALQQDAAAKGNSCDQEDVQVRTEALSALAQSDMTAATPMLRRVLERKDPCSLELRRRALSILLRRGDTAATNAAIAVAKNNDETLDLRTDAISYLSRLPGDNAQTTLEELLRSSNDKDIQRAAVRSLARTDNVRARQAVRGLIERADVTEQLRAEAISSFDSDRSTTEDAAWLRSAYAKMPSERLKTSILAALGRMGGSENEAFIMNVARNDKESSDVRATAIGRLSRSTTITIADLIKLYDSAESRQMRDQLINAMSQRKEPDATDKLLDVAKNGTDPYLRRQAVNALGRREDPRAKAFLQEIVNK